MLLKFKMELKIEKKDHKQLVERMEIEAKSTSKTTPNNIEVQEAIASELKKDKELVVVKHIYPEFGSDQQKIIVYVYDSIDAKKKFEKLGKKALEKIKKAEAAAAEAKAAEEKATKEAEKPAEAPAEEKKENKEEKAEEPEKEKKEEPKAEEKKEEKKEEVKEEK